MASSRLAACVDLIVRILAHTAPYNDDISIVSAVSKAALRRNSHTGWPMSDKLVSAVTQHSDHPVFIEEYGRLAGALAPAFAWWLRKKVAESRPSRFCVKDHPPSFRLEVRTRSSPP